jgi:hypothetical protein
VGPAFLSSQIAGIEERSVFLVVFVFLIVLVFIFVIEVVVEVVVEVLVVEILVVEVFVVEVLVVEFVVEFVVEVFIVVILVIVIIFELFVLVGHDDEAIGKRFGRERRYVFGRVEPRQGQQGTTGHAGILVFVVVWGDPISTLLSASARRKSNPKNQPAAKPGRLA